MADNTEAAAKLKQACDEAYDAHNDSCSHAVWYVLKKIQNADEPFRDANTLVDYMTGNWDKVTADVGLDLANLGQVVVGGKKEPGHGHVIVIYPGNMILNGGYQYYWTKGKKYLTLPGDKLYPRCLSTSIGSWPGAKSKGDKTVWDPWADNDKFERVLFWASKQTP